MPIYYGSQKIGKVYKGSQEIKEVYYGSTLVYQNGPLYDFPTKAPYPEVLADLEIVDSVSGQNYKIGVIQDDGWYRIATRAETGSGQWCGYRGGASGGCISDAIVWLYAGSKYIIWGANERWTGYISPSGNSSSPVWKSDADTGMGVLGGGGACGNYSGESGGGGGGAGGHGTLRHTDAGYGGGGTGCIVGIDHDGPTLTQAWNHGGFSVTSVECMVLAGGGGSPAGDNHEPRTGGAGGGAWGRGGHASYNNTCGQGPGGDWGRGEDSGGGYWAGPTRGAWCVRDYSRNRFEYGYGVKSGNSCPIGSTYIYKLPSVPGTKFAFFNTAGTHTYTAPFDGYYTFKVVGGGGGAAGSFGYQYFPGSFFSRRYSNFASAAAGGAGGYACAQRLYFTAGTEFTITVGGEGSTATGGGEKSGGTGGLSSVKLAADGTLIVQGNGGSGGSACGSSRNFHAEGGAGGTVAETEYTTDSAVGAAGGQQRANHSSRSLATISASAIGGSGPSGMDYAGSGKSISVSGSSSGSYGDPNSSAVKVGRVTIMAEPQ